MKTVVDQSVKVGKKENFEKEKVAPEEGFEPPTNRLTADCSTAELLRNSRLSAS